MDKSVRSISFFLFNLFFYIFFLLSCSKKWDTLNHITYISGKLFIINPEGLEISGQIGKLNFPSKITTGENSFGVVSITFPNYGYCRISIYPNSFVEIRRTYKEPKGMIHVEISNIFGIALLKSDKCVFSYASAEIKDSFVRIIGELSNNHLEVIEGSIKIGRKTIQAGSGMKISEKLEQYSLNQAVESVLPVQGRFPKPLVFMWKRADGGTRYFLEISEQRNFDTVSLILETNSNTFFPEQITIKSTSDFYFWRVWYRDKEGRGSFFSTPVSFTVRTQRVIK